MSQTEQRSSDLYSAPRPTDTDYQRLYNAVFGDGLIWDGVVKQLQDIKREVSQLSGDVKELAKGLATINDEVDAIRAELSKRPQAQLDQRALYGMMAATIIMAIVVGVGIYILANGGGA